MIKYDDPGRIERVGVENLRGMSEFDPTMRTKDYGNMDRPNYATEEYYADENHYANFITFDNIKNGWVRNVTALHFVYSMVGTQRGSKWITVQDCVSREPSRGGWAPDGSRSPCADNSRWCSVATPTRDATRS